jgi:hypothetical protein
MSHRVYIGTHFEITNWRDTITKLYENIGAKAIDA